MLANQRPRFRLRFSQSQGRTWIWDRVSQSAARIQMLSHQLSKPCETIPCTPEITWHIPRPRYFSFSLNYLYAYCVGCKTVPSLFIRICEIERALLVNDDKFIDDDKMAIFAFVYRAEMALCEVDFWSADQLFQRPCSPIKKKSHDNGFVSSVDQ